MNSVQNPAYQAGMEARFAIAARHSRMVRLLRVAVPAAVALALAVIIAISIFNPFRMLLPKLPLDSRKPGGLRLQDHDGGAASVRLHAGSAAL